MKALAVPAAGDPAVLDLPDPFSTHPRPDPRSDLVLLGALRTALGGTDIAELPLTAHWAAWFNRDPGHREPVNKRATWLARSFGAFEPRVGLHGTVVISGLDRGLRIASGLSEAQIEALRRRLRELPGAAGIPLP